MPSSWQAFTTPETQEVITYFVNGKDVPIGRNNVASEAYAVQHWVLNVFALVLDSLSLGDITGPTFSPENFCYTNKMAGNDPSQMVFIRFMVGKACKSKYYAWMAYGSDGEYGALIYASVMQVVENTKLQELAHLTNMKDKEQKEWSSLDRKFRSKMMAMKDMIFVLKEEGWIHAPGGESSQFKLSFVTEKGNDMTVVLGKLSTKIIDDTKAMKSMTQRILDTMHNPSLLHLQPGPLLWNDCTVFDSVWMSGKGKKNSGMGAPQWLSSGLKEEFEEFRWPTLGLCTAGTMGSLCVL
ncbi:hypothetical protein BDP27DRAFT_1361445 [Rhodocollybia butyracea]|uniref:Uncharacterized protein n=1 Tax=Rhodocollybia butyracea TaxID=206335 RepID=A0A9P5Q0T5_9AGAR|nr:hypothetical protein BDP27DRAFT_1361445 [Rhodocollybia butyracea]